MIEPELLVLGVEELNTRYHNEEVLLFTIHAQHGKSQNPEGTP